MRSIKSNKVRYMRGILSSFLFISLLLHPLVSEAKSDREQNGLMGPVRRVIMEFGIWKSGKRLNGTNASMSTQTYDTNGNQIKDESNSFIVGTANIFWKSKSVHNYDTEGRTKETIFYTQDRADLNKWVIMSKSLITYNNDNNISKIESFGKNGSLDKKSVYTYDNGGNPIQFTIYNSNGSILIESNYTYDSKGTATHTSIAYKNDGSINFRSVNKTDDKGNVIEGLTFEPDGSIKEKRVYIRDSNGKRTEQTVYDADGLSLEKETYSYEYDSIGNWIKETISSWDRKSGQERQIIRTRTIEYFPSEGDLPSQP